MTAPNLTCSECWGGGNSSCHPRCHCPRCGGQGRRAPLLSEWDTLVAERDALKAGHRLMVDEWDRLLAVEKEARNVLEAYDNAERESDWTGALIDTRLRDALATEDGAA